MLATPPTIAPPTERRVAPRRQPAMGTVCRLNAGDGQPPALALIWNISTTGISMLLNEPREPGTMLSGLLETIAGSDNMVIVARVVHVKKLATGDYYIGATFHRPITAEEMKPFVA
jgi:hypothetical protein